MLHGPVPLGPTIRRAGFASGTPALDDWFCNHALQAHRADSTKVFVVHDEHLAAQGFYALSAGSVSRKEAPDRVRKGLGAHPIPVALLGRLAVDERAQGKGLGQALLKDALGRIAQASESLGVRCVLAHAKDEPAKSFYAHFGFEPSPIDPLWMFLLLKDLRRQMPRPGTAGRRAR